MPFYIVGDKDEKASVKSFQSGSGSGVNPGTHGSSSNSTTQHLGTFYHLPHYMRLYDVLSGTFSSCQMSLDVQNDKFSQFVHCALASLAQVLEVTTLSEVGNHAEELLQYLRAVVKIEPSKTILCVQQVR